MPQLLTLPYAVPLSAAGLILPGAKLSFFQTGTSTPQPVYQDVDLTVPHTQPIVADGAGRFAKIYLDPALPDYRILLTDSSDVTQPGYPIDGVPAAAGGGRQLRLTATAPDIILSETDASANNGKWRIRANAEVLSLEIGDTAEGVWNPVFTMSRAGTTPGTTNFLSSLTQEGDHLIIGRNAFKSANSTRFSTTTLEEDVDLTLVLQVGTWVIEGDLVFDATTTAGMGAKFAVSFDGTLDYQKNALISSFVNGTGAISDSAFTSGSPLTFATVSTSSGADHVGFRFALSVSAFGILTFLWAQNSSTANNLTLRAGSWMRAYRISN